MKNEAFDSISLYLQWGYYAKNPMIQLAIATPTSHRTLIKKEQRLEKLTNLFQLKKRIRVQDYIEFLDYKISKRTAELDLSQWAKKLGKQEALLIPSDKTISVFNFYRVCFSIRVEREGSFRSIFLPMTGSNTARNFVYNSN